MLALPPDSGAKSIHGSWWTPAGNILPAVASPLDKLERAFKDTVDASGADFFRRLREYEALLRKRGPIKRAVKRLRKQAEAADKKFVREDDGFARELQTFRNTLVRRVPEADDSATPRPEANGQRAPARSLEGHEWAYTLANFDALRDDRDDKIRIGQGLDHGRAGMMGAILEAKLVELRFPRREPETGVMNREETDQRPDLEDLHQGIGEVNRKEETAYRRAEQALEDAGIFGLTKIEHVARLLEPQDPLPRNTEDEKLVAFSAALQEASAGFHHLREAIRPPEAGQPLGRDAQNILNIHERDLRQALDRLHRPLRDRLEASRRFPRWNELGRGEKLSLIFGVPGLILAVAGIVIAFILAG